MYSLIPEKPLRLEFELSTKPSKRAVCKLPGVKKAFDFFTPGKIISNFF